MSPLGMVVTEGNNGKLVTFLKRQAGKSTTEVANSPSHD